MPIQPAITRESLVADMRRAYKLGVFGLLVIALTVLTVGWVDKALMESVFSSREVTKLARQTRLLTLDRETAVRGYLVGGDRHWLQPENTASTLLPAHLDSLVVLTDKSASRRDRAEAIRQAVARWERGYVKPALGGTAAGRDSALQELAGKELFKSVRAAFASFISAEERLYAQRVAFEQFVVRFSTVIILLEILFVILMMRRLSRRTVGQAQQVLEQQEQLEEQAVELEQQALELEEQAVQLEEQYENTLNSASTLAITNDQLNATVAELKNSRDETRRLSAEREHAQSLLDFVLDSSPVGFGLFDRSLRFTTANNAMAEINQVPVRDLIGKSPRDLVTPELAAQAEKLLTGVMESGEPVMNVPLTGAIASEPGTERHWLVSYFPVHSGPQKETLGVGIMCSEITDRKRLEEQLAAARKMEAVGRLAGGVAHDFNNLLTAIKSYSELLLADMDEANPQRTDVSEINAAADRAAELTRHLLAFSRQQMLRPDAMNVDKIVPRDETAAKASRGATIMLVEDDDAVRNVAARVLKRAGFAVLEASNGHDAVELYKVTDCCADLILTDVVMPEMNGPEMARQILDVNPSAKILFMSGYTADRVVRENLLAPGSAFIEKPFSPEALIRKAREILDAPETSGAAA
jgi:PAS domain S-box-containing protein